MGMYSETQYLIIYVEMIIHINVQIHNGIL